MISSSFRWRQRRSEGVESTIPAHLTVERVHPPRNLTSFRLSYTSFYRRVADLLRLKAESVPASAKGSQTSQKILRTLTTTVQGLAELRNELGLGHGRSAPSPALAWHARLALNSTVTVTEFLLDTWQERG
jgi:Abortive infection C-terminus